MYCYKTETSKDIIQ